MLGTDGTYTLQFLKGWNGHWDLNAKQTNWTAHLFLASLGVETVSEVSKSTLLSPNINKSSLWKLHNNLGFDYVGFYSFSLT